MRNGCGENTGNIQRDIAVTDDHCSMPREVDIEIGVLRLVAVLADQFAGRKAACEFLTWRVQIRVVRASDRIDDSVVPAREFSWQQIATDTDVAEEPEAIARSNRVETPATSFFSG
ncbi:hypothetical protein MCHIJ_36540 [Mycolicibacterium chitae]|nr:hypothetical protein [Mycolicibacterium chitae]BBZ04217.1 hypothetical protein MCHIJ_36540 [Mycolicibacterium chitae]